MGKIYIGDKGTRIRLRTGEDITGAKAVHIKVRRPDGVAVTWSGTVSATEYVAHYVDPAEIPIGGEYLLQSYVNLDGWEGRGETAILRVHNLFK